jgi:hypothetical protein
MDHTTRAVENLSKALFEDREQPNSLSDMEQRIRHFMLWLGGILLQVWLKWEEGRYPPQHKPCPHCGGQANYERQREGTLHTLVGTLKYRRAYYTCETCHQGHYPLDDRLGLRPNQMSAELERLAGLVGVQTAFGKGCDLLEELTLIRLSDHSLDKSAQAYGREIDQVEQEWRAAAADQATQLKRKRNARPVLRMYGAMDGALMHLRGDEDNPWRELKIGAWFQAKGQPPKTPDGKWRIQAENITYYADVCDAQTFGELVWASGLHRNVDQAVELIFIGDGAAWIWRLVDQYFPHAIQIVDWFHACEYLVDVAHTFFPEAKKRHEWLTTQRTALWKGELNAVIAACQTHIQPDRGPDDDPAQKAVTYFTNNRHRMDYPTYRKNGYQIGSGTIESAAKQIVAQRMKVTGAIWAPDSARLVAKARAAFLSDQWDDLAARRTHLNHVA